MEPRAIAARARPRVLARRTVVVAAATFVAALAVMLGARAWLAGVLTAPGAPETQRALAGANANVTPGASTNPPVPPRPVRVVLLDGLARSDAHGPALEAFCALGMDLAIDVGFPTKSLPVQSVLWSGLTAQQSGIAMRNELPRPLTDTLPARVAGSRAVVEAWPQIARGAGFAQVDTPPRDAFTNAASLAVDSSAPLVLVHVLAIDEAGHRHGRDATYRARAARADDLVAMLLAHNLYRDPHDDMPARPMSWLVLSDHGHVARGGHGDIEPEVRIVRGCVVPRPPGAPASAAVHLVDVSRHLHDALGIAPPPRAVGRPLAVAAAFPDPDATVPHVSRLAQLAALVALALGLAAAARWGRPRLAALAPALAVAAYVAACGTPSLSQRDPGAAILVGAVVAIVVFALPGRGHPARVIALVVPAFSTVIAAAFLCRLPLALVGGPPARLPFATAWAQILVATVTPALLVGVVLGSALLSERRTSGNRTETSGGSDRAVRDSDTG